MKVMFVNTLYHPQAVGGAETSVKLLAEACQRGGDEAVVVSLASDGVASETEVDGVRVHRVPLWNLFFPYPWQRYPRWRAMAWHLVEAWNPVMARRLGELVDREKPDLVQVHNLLGFSSAIWPALERRGVPVVQSLHDHYTVCVNSLMFRNGRNCARRCVHCRVLCLPRKRLSRRVDVVTAVSRRLMDRVTRFGLFRGVGSRLVVYNASADEPRPPRPVPQPGAPLRVGFLGRLEPFKGPDVLLAAAQRIGGGRLRVRLGGTGEPGYVAVLAERFGGPDVAFLGRVDRTEFFEQVDILVVPSIGEEALGRVVHEAYAFGVPVIGSDAGGIPEIVREGATGFLFPPGDVEALERVLRRLIDDPPDWAAMSDACRAEAELFAIERIDAAYRTAWAEAIAVNRDRAARRQGARPPIRSAVSLDRADASPP